MENSTPVGSVVSEIVQVREDLCHIIHEARRSEEYRPEENQTVPLQERIFKVVVFERGI